MVTKKSERLQLATEEKRKQPCQRFLNLVLKFVVLAGLVFALKYGYAYFKVAEIKVTGAVGVKKEALLESCGLRQGRSIFLLNEKKIAQCIMADYPQIKAVKIEKTLPDQVVLSVTERTLLAYVKAAAGFWLIDQETVCFAFSEQAEAGWPVVSGVDEEFLMPGEPLRCPLRRATLLSLFASWQGPEAVAIASMDFSDPYNLVLYTKEGFQVWLGDERQMETKLLLIKESIRLIDEGAAGRLDVRSGRRLVFSESAKLTKKEEDL